MATVLMMLRSRGVPRTPGTVPRERACGKPLRGRGFTQLEFVVILTVIAVLLAVAVDRLWILQEEAEATAMAQVLGSLRSALGMTVASDLVHDDTADLNRLAGSNPMRVLAETPKNYLGVFDEADPARIAGGHWYFDRASRMLVYQVRNQNFFRGGLGPPARAGFVIRVTQARHAPDDATGAVLVAVAPYRWGARRTMSPFAGLAGLTNKLMDTLNWRQ